MMRENRMGNYDNLKTKWRKLVEQEGAGRCFDWERLIPGSFCVHISDEGGTMPCRSHIETTGFFDSNKDALAFYRFADIPRILDWDTDTHKMPLPDETELYLTKYKTDKKRQINDLIGLIDTAIKTEVINTTELSLIREAFNGIFSTTNPEVQILAWGNLYETLTSTYFIKSFEEDIEEESDEDEKPSTVLKELLDSGNFNEADNSHLSLAKTFFESRLIT